MDEQSKKGNGGKEKPGGGGVLLWRCAKVGGVGKQKKDLVNVLFRGDDVDRGGGKRAAGSYT